MSGSALTVKHLGVALTVCALVAPTGLGGCSSNSSASLGLNTGEAEAVPGMKVNLPSPPSFAEEDLPKEFPDGTVTVFGLRKQMDKYLGKDVKVKAYLLDLYVCPPCPKKQVCKMCDQPHFFLSDKPDGKKEKALMIVDYLMPKQKPPALTVGKQYTIEGNFARNSPTGFASSDGLLLFTRMTDDKNVEFLSPAAALEAKALKGEAGEQAQLNEMQKALEAKSAALKKNKK
jgi:hypothetical protein